MFDIRTQSLFSNGVKPCPVIRNQHSRPLPDHYKLLPVRPLQYVNDFLGAAEREETSKKRRIG
jgi:hypothetical protein